MMRQYRRDEGTICNAIQFVGVDEIEGHLFEVMDILAKANLYPSYRATEVTDEWQENEAGDDYEQIVIPEHIFLAASNDRLKVGDYVLEREGDVYVMNGSLFEAIWTLIEEGDSLELEPIRKADTCVNCGENIANFTTDGVIWKTFKHSSGPNYGQFTCALSDEGKWATPSNYKA